MPLSLTSEIFMDNRVIPTVYTCEGKSISPPLTWSSVPDNAKSLVLIMDDPDAPDPKAPKMTYVHWVLYNIPVHTKGLEENIKKLPEGTLEGVNDAHTTGYYPPCPPIGEHRYFFKLYALDTVLPDLNQPTKTILETKMKGHIIEKTELIGTYQKIK